MNWIKVSEGLPEDAKAVLVWIELLGYWQKAVYENGNFLDMRFNRIPNVTHWAYIEPPKE